MSAHGCIIAWLPKESAESPRPRESGPYARDTYGELGELRGRMMRRERMRFVMGGDAHFPGLDVIVRNYQLALGENFPIYKDIEELVAAAIHVAEHNLYPEVNPPGPFTNTAAK